MAYSELIKNFEKVRAYMREFYVASRAGRNMMPRAHAPMMMSAAGWRVGWGITCTSRRHRRERMFSCRWIAA